MVSYVICYIPSTRYEEMTGIVGIWLDTWETTQGIKLHFKCMNQMYESNVSSESNVSVLELPLCKNGPLLRYQDLEETLRRKKLLI